MRHSPFSLRRKCEKGCVCEQLAYGAVKRGVQLMFFAIFIQHFYPRIMLSAPQDVRAWLLALMLRRTVPHVQRAPLKMPRVRRIPHQAGCLRCGYGDAALHGLCQRSGVQPLHQQHHHPAAASMALFGSLTYLLTMYSWWARVAVLAAPGGRGTKCAGGRLGHRCCGAIPRAVDVQV
ncbi:MAG: hypothetical protein ACLUVY_05615 [Bacteroides uniformis]